VDVTYARRTGTGLLRGRNMNAPVGGVRRDPGLGNVIEIRGLGRARADEISSGGSLRLPTRGLFLSGRYTYERSHDDGDHPLALPANPLEPDEWGPARDDVRHRLWVFAVLEPLRNLRLGTTLSAASAPPYTITTGRDDNADGVFNDRPPGTGRNSARAAGFARLDTRLAWRFGAGAPRGATREQAAAPGRTAGDDSSTRGWRGRHLLVSEVYVRATNVLNAVHPLRFSGVMTSPFYGQPAAARDPRRLEVGARVVF
jgi:hypothetical protein